MSIPKIDKAIIEEYKKLDSTSISDAMDRIGIPAGLYGIKPVTPGTSMCGQAFTLIYSVCRDIKDVRNIKYPIFSNGYYMVTGKDRVEVAAINEPVTVAGIKVCPGDLVFGDDTGALVIPFDKVETVLNIAKEIERKEEIIRENVKSGLSLREARAKTGYHNLQTKEAK